MPVCARCSLRALFVALNDEAVVVRVLAVGVVGRLAVFNPAYVLPALRRHLMQLLNDMDHSPDSRQREGARGPSCLPACRFVGFVTSCSCFMTWTTRPIRGSEKARPQEKNARKKNDFACLSGHNVSADLSCRICSL